MAIARRKFAVMTLTEAAAGRIREIVEDSDPPIRGIRVGIRNGGCAGMAYTVDPVTEPDPKDDVVEDKGATVWVDPKAVLFLLGTEMDFHADKFGATFEFHNPNQVSACGCGESVELKPATLAE